jgi:hypothetical protein
VLQSRHREQIDQGIQCVAMKVADPFCHASDDQPPLARMMPGGDTDRTPVGVTTPGLHAPDSKLIAVSG